MLLNGKYIQYSKLFVGIAGLVYLVQLISTTILVCTCNYAANALLEIFATTTGLVGVFFGCYTGNSAAEKYLNTKNQNTQNKTSG